MSCSSYVLSLEMVVRESSGRQRPPAPCTCGCAGIVYKECGGKTKMLVSLSMVPSEEGARVPASSRVAFETACPVMRLSYSDTSSTSSKKAVWDSEAKKWVLLVAPVHVTRDRHACWSTTIMDVTLTTAPFEVRSKPSPCLAVFPNTDYGPVPVRKDVANQLQQWIAPSDFYILPSNKKAVLVILNSRVAFNKVYASLFRQGQEAMVAYPVPCLNRIANCTATLNSLTMPRPVPARGFCVIPCSRKRVRKEVPAVETFIPTEVLMERSFLWDPLPPLSPIMTEAAFDPLLVPLADLSPSATNPLFPFALE